MQVLIRSDASITIGSGHLMRCLTLADQLRENGYKVIFLCAEVPGAMFELIETRGYDCKILSPSVVHDSNIDAIECISFTKEYAHGIVDWVIVDHYQLDFKWEEMLRPFCRHLMVLDDIADRPHTCDLLLDQNYNNQARYKNLVPENCKQLLGPKYALLRPEYSSYRDSAILRNRPLQRVFIFFGGSDPDDLTGMALLSLSSQELAYLKVDIVIGANYSHKNELKKLATLRGNTSIYGPRTHLADLMASADIGVGAGGVTNWERMTVGLPSIVIALSDNQIPISKQLHLIGAIRYIGKSEHVTEAYLRNALLDEVSNEKYMDQIVPAMGMCDGNGVERVLQNIRSFE